MAPRIRLFLMDPIIKWWTHWGLIRLLRALLFEDSGQSQPLQDRTHIDDIQPKQLWSKERKYTALFPAQRAPWKRPRLSHSAAAAHRAPCAAPIRLQERKSLSRMTPSLKDRTPLPYRWDYPSSFPDYQPWKTRPS